MKNKHIIKNENMSVDDDDCRDGLPRGCNRPFGAIFVQFRSRAKPVELKIRNYVCTVFY